MQREERQVQLTRLLQVADQRRGAHLVHELRRDVGGNRDHAMAAEQDERERRGVVAAVDREVARRAPDEIGATLDVRGRFLDADDARHLREAQRGVVQQVRHRAPGHVVHDHRQVDGLGDLAEVPVQAFLRRLVVVGDHGKAGGRAVLLGRRGELDRFRGRVAAGAGDDRDPPAGMLDRDADQLLVLVEVDRRRFAGGADHHDAVGTLGHMPVDELPEAREVETAVLVHWRDDRNQASGNHAAILARLASPRTAQMRCSTAFSVVPCSKATTVSATKASSSSPGCSRNFGLEGRPKRSLPIMKVS